MEIDHPVLGNYEIIKKLGEGSFASVYLAKHKVLHYLVAIKIFQEQNRIGKMHKSIIHPFICQDFDSIKTPSGKNGIIMEYVEGETLLDYVNHNTSLSEEIIKNIFGQLVIAIDFLHKNHIIHRDLKCENVMIDKNQNIRLIDLDFSCQNVNTHTTICGSPSYIAPEMYGNSIDIWSLGIIINSITYGVLPFESQNINTMLRLISSKEPDFPNDQRASSNLVYIIEKMLIKNPNKRITIDEIKKDPFFIFDSQYNEYTFKEQNINCLLVDPYSKLIQEKSILQKMHLTVKETINALCEIKNRQITYNSMTYAILYKDFGSNATMKSYKRCFLCPYKKINKKSMSENTLPLIIASDPSLNDKIMSSSSQFQLDEIKIEKKEKPNINSIF